MKRLGLFFLLTVFTLSTGLAQNNGGKSGEEDTSPVIQFDTTSYNFGNIEYNSDGTYDFKFKNIGKEPLLLTHVRSSCGCTTPLWPKEPIKPGETNSIKVKYNTRIVGNFSKSIIVVSNAKNKRIVLRIKGQVGSPNKK